MNNTILKTEQELEHTSSESPVPITSQPVDLKEQVIMYTAHEVAQKLYDLTQGLINDLAIKPYPESAYVKYTSMFHPKKHKIL